MSYDSLSVRAASAFFFEEPSLYSSVTDELLFGTALRICGEADRKGWIYAETSYRYRGYIKTNKLSKNTESGDCFDYFTVTSSFCDALSTAEYRYQPALILPRGSVVRRRKHTPHHTGAFTDIDIEGKCFFVSAANIEKIHMSENTDRALLRENIALCAMSYLGTPYRWGGKSPSGIDCSGLCFMAYALCGIALWRDALFDERYVFAVEREDLKRADLIYYQGHIAMYLGSDCYIHSSATQGGVVINSLDKQSPDYYRALDGTQLCFARSVVFR